MRLYMYFFAAILACALFEKQSYGAEISKNSVGQALQLRLKKKSKVVRIEQVDKRSDPQQHRIMKRLFAMGYCVPMQIQSENWRFQHYGLQNTDYRCAFNASMKLMGLVLGMPRVAQQCGLNRMHKHAHGGESKVSCELAPLIRVAYAMYTPHGDRIVQQAADGVVSHHKPVLLERKALTTQYQVTKQFLGACVKHMQAVGLKSQMPIVMISGYQNGLKYAEQVSGTPEIIIFDMTVQDPASGRDRNCFSWQYPEKITLEENPAQGRLVASEYRCCGIGFYMRATEHWAHAFACIRDEQSNWRLHDDAQVTPLCAPTISRMLNRGSIVYDSTWQRAQLNNKIAHVSQVWYVRQ